MLTSDVEARVLERIRPTPDMQRKAEDLAKRMSSQVVQWAHENGLDAEPMVVGSLAKHTYMEGVDIDLFVLFPPETPREELQRLGLEIGHNIIKDGEERYAEHPYVHGFVDGHEVDLVPCYRLSSPADRMSAVDRTPFHTRYVLEHLSEEQRDHVILLKRFMKGVGVYGAEASVGGFSGYLCELLVLKYGSFPGVLKGAGEWDGKTMLSLEKKAEKSFSESLIFIDPVDGNRNVAAAVTVQKKALFSHASRCYIAEPSERFFFPEPSAKITISDAESILQIRGTKLLLAATPRPINLVLDVLFPQFNKMHKVLVERCGQEGFPVVSSMAEAHGEWLYILLELERDIRSPVFKHLGPPIWSDHSQNFLDRWTKDGDGMSPPYIEEGRWVVLAPREKVKADEVVFDGLTRWGIGKDLGVLASEGKIEVYTGRKALEKADSTVLSSFFDKRFPWERK